MAGHANHMSIVKSAAVSLHQHYIDLFLVCNLVWGQKYKISLRARQILMLFYVAMAIQIILVAFLYSQKVFFQFIVSYFIVLLVSNLA